jgi:hypothetical protein
MKLSTTNVLLKTSLYKIARFVGEWDNGEETIS